MSSSDSLNKYSLPETSPMIALIEETVTAPSFAKLAESFLPSIATITGASSAFLYVADPYLQTCHFFSHELPPETEDKVKELAVEQLTRHAGQADPALIPVSLPASNGSNGAVTLYTLVDTGKCFGLVGLLAGKQDALTLPDYWSHLLRIAVNTMCRINKLEETERRLVHLNTYKTVSSLLSQELCLHDLLDATLYCCMEVVSAEAASVLLLDDEKKKFKFYQTEGPAKLTLMAETFPADKGLAGSVMNSNCSEVINDVPNDPRFYGKIDTESGFQTRNMIVVPLIAGEEKVGVLEVLNKAGGGPFTEEECLLLSSIAEEIAFAIRNARVFEYVVSSYCKQRQGQNSCKGCERPLGSWTPCAKYRTCEIDF